MKALILLFLALTVSTDVFAQGGTRGGGDVIRCRGKWKGIHLADTFTLKIRGILKLNTGLPENVLMESYLNTLRSESEALASAIDAQLKRLSFVAVKKVKELEDDDLAVTERGCKKDQLAVQDLASGRVEYQESHYQALSDEEKVLFKIHEAFIAEKKKPNENTQEIREWVAAIPESQRFSEFLIRTVYKNLLVPEFKWSTLQNHIGHFWVFAVYMDFYNDAFQEFCSNANSMDILRDALGGASSTDRTMNYQAFYNAVKRTIYPSYYAMADLGSFMQAIRNARDAADLAFELSKFNAPSWVTANEVDEARLRLDVKLLVTKCPKFALRKDEIEKDLEHYLSQVRMMRE